MTFDVSSPVNSGGMNRCNRRVKQDDEARGQIKRMSHEGRMARGWHAEVEEAPMFEFEGFLLHPQQHEKKKI